MGILKLYVRHLGGLVIRLRLGLGLSVGGPVCSVWLQEVDERWDYCW